MMTEARIGTGLIGFGLGGRIFHAPLIACEPLLHLRQIVSSQEAAIRAAWPGVQPVATPEELLADPETALVVIATPNESHYPLAAAALAAGKHVVVDKPFTVTRGEAQALIALAQHHNRLLTVFQNRRWDGPFLTARQLIEAGTLGEVLTYEARFDRFRPIIRPRWREQALPGSGVWYDLGAHLADQALQLFGWPERISADLIAQRPGATADDSFHVTLRYGSRRAILQAGSLVADSPFQLAVHGTRGSYLAHGRDPQGEQLEAGLRPGDPGYGVESAEKPSCLTTIAADGTLTRRFIPTLPGCYDHFYRAVAQAIRTGSPPPVSHAEALALVTLLEQVAGLGKATAPKGRSVSAPEGAA
jgi:scyllo-inositol 2-dehydrogenase (NADP+)